MSFSDLQQQFTLRRFSLRGEHYNDARQGNHCHYIGYLRRGTVRIVGEGRELSFSEGELFYIPKGFSYESFWRGDPDIVFESYGFSYFPHSAASPYPLQGVEIDERVLAALEAVADHRVSDCRGIGNLYLLLDAMLPHMKPEMAGRSHRTVEVALDYMQSQSSLSVPAMARHCGVSESGLYAAFRKVKGCTPVEMWHRICVMRATELLEETDLSIEEIAIRLEFCSASYFRRIFKRVTGKTPRRVRNEAKDFSGI